MTEYIFFLFLGSCVLYFVAGTLRINRNCKLIWKKFEDFENGLKKNITEYICYTNNHPHVWGEDEYSKLKDKIEASPRWQGNPVWPYGGAKFSLKVDEEKSAIYLAVGTDSFNWDSLAHHEEWIKRKVIYY